MNFYAATKIKISSRATAKPRIKWLTYQIKIKNTAVSVTGRATYVTNATL